MKESILNYEISGGGVDACAGEIADHIRRAQAPGWLACLNPHSYAVATLDQQFARALKSASWLLPDGVGIVHASKLLGGDIGERVTGWDIFLRVHALLNERGAKVFFLGASNETLAKIQRRMSVDYPNVRVVGTYSPPYKHVFSETETEAMRGAVNSTRPDVLWVGMTAPKQEKWLADNIAHLDVRFAGAIGAVFDFYAGNIKRSHALFQRAGFEWLPRLLQEPARLWRRTFVSAPIFYSHVLRETLKKRLPSSG